MLKRQKSRWVARPEYVKAFTLIELMISLSIIAFLGLAFTYSTKRNQISMRSSDTEGSLSSEQSLVRKMLEADLRQVALVNPSCASNPANTSAITPCADIKVRSGYTPLPGLDVTAVTALTSMAPPSNLTDAPSTLAGTSDALRIVTYNMTGSFNCRLNFYRSPNPSTSASETLWPLRQGCTGNLSTGTLYVLMQEVGTRVFGNLFQITNLVDLGGVATSTDQLEVTASSSTGLYNQIGGLGNSGFSNGGRIYPVKIIEWAYQANQGLFRREIIPSSTNLNGFGAWRLISSSVEGIQFFPITLPTTGPVQHQRTLQLTADTANDGAEDIRGVNVRFIVKASKETQDGVLYDNPLTATTEDDHFPRQEGLFYVDFRNTKPAS